MKINLTSTNEAYNILKEYKGINPYIISLKNSVYAYKDKTLNDFEIEYILTNHDKEPIYLNKLIKISKWYGEKKQIDWNTEFIPEKLVIGYYFGETSTHYHCMVKYRQSVDFQSLFIPKKEILNPLFEENFLDKQIDFDKYNINGFKLKPHQERGIKFLTTRKKGILSTQMGGGKTCTSIVAALENNYKKILIICPASLKTNWKSEIERFIPSDDITIVEGSKWKESRFTIINYDILKKFYTVPKETKKVKEKEFTDEGTIEWKIVEKEVKTNKKSIVDECLDNSQLYQANFDLLIIDEAHRLSNKTSGMYQIVEDLIKRTKINSVFALTGTMVKNDPNNLYNILKIVGCDFCQTYQDYSNYLQKYCGAKQIFRNRKERDYYTSIFLKQHNKTEWHQLDYFEKQELNDYLSKTCKKIWIMGEHQNLDELAERIKHLYYRELNEEVLNSININKELIEYHLTNEESVIYNNAWNEYINNSEEKNIDKLIQNHKLIEGSIFRQVLADFMVKRSIDLAEKEISNGNKIVIFCCFDKELYSLQEYFGERCVIYNGKMTAKKKDAALNTFKTNEECKVFIGNLQSCNVGLNINEANIAIFNNVDFVPAINNQAEFRIIRIGKTDDVKIYYQKFSNTYQDRLFEILDVKTEITEQLIKTEKEK